DGRAGPIPRRDDPNDPYKTGGGLPSGGEVVNGGVQNEQSFPTVAPPGQCRCVPYFQCKDGILVIHGEGIIDVRTKDPPVTEIPLSGYAAEDSQCPGVDQQCCKDPSKDKPAREIIPTCGIRNDNGINSHVLQTKNK